MCLDCTKVKTKSFVRNDFDKCIAGVVAVPECSKFRIYVAWGWEKMAQKQHFSISKSREIYTTVTDEYIEKTANYGYEVKDEKEISKVFGWLL